MLPLQQPFQNLGTQMDYRGSQEKDGTSRAPTKADTPKPKAKVWKSKLEQYFDAKGQTGKEVVEYHTKAEGYGYKSTVICPNLGYLIGEKRPTKDDAEQNAAKKALQELEHE